MTALAVRVPQAPQLNWPRVGAWSGSLSLHILVVALMLIPAAAITFVRHAPPEQVVTIITPPPPAKPIPVLPTPVKLVPQAHTPPVVAPVVPIVAATSNMPVYVPDVATPVAQPVQAAPIETAPSAIAYGNRTQVAYPREALRNREQGTVILRVLVDIDGSVQTVEIEKTSGSRSLDRAAREAVAMWHFHPATRNGIAISAWASVPITFNLNQL